MKGGEKFYLRLFNIILATAHATAGIFVIAFVQFNDEYSGIFPVYHTQATWIDCVSKKHEHASFGLSATRKTAIQLLCDTATKPENVMNYYELKSIDMDFSWIIGSFFAITAVAHLLYSTALWNTVLRCIDEGYSYPYRWIEYGLSSSIMFFLMLYFFGITDIVALLSLTLTMFFSVTNVYFYKQKLMSLQALLFSGFCYILLWLIPIVYFFVNFGNVLANVPNFVYAILVSEIVLFSSFAIILLFDKTIIKSEVAEIFYGLTSATSKLLLGVVVTFTAFKSSSSLS